MKKKILLSLLFLSNTFMLFAQGPGAPGGDGGGCADPDANCPLDTWIIAFAAFALIGTTIYLY
ncbi:MAG TPA: hypothetical protein VIQ77_07575, partial [Mucilaginibacter sp.]